LKNGGRITLATNVEDYRLEATEAMEKFWNLTVLEDRKIQSNELPRTHFESKYALRGDDLWNLVFEKP
jgi:tRNA G46 methylase TrmB